MYSNVHLTVGGANLSNINVFLNFLFSYHFFLFVCLQAEAEETEVEQQQLHYQQAGISHTCKTNYNY